MSTVEKTSGTAQQGSFQVVAFRLGDYEYAFPLEQIAEITPFRELHHMPHAPKNIEGILDLRGAYLPVVNLRRRLGLPEGETLKGSFILILDVEGQKTGVLVDSIDQVMTIPLRHFHRPSILIVGHEGEWIRGFIVMEERVISLLSGAMASTSGSVHGGIGFSDESLSLEHRMEQELESLIALAPPKEKIQESNKVIPQMESVIQYTENEVTKVLERVDQVLSNVDRIYQGLARLKQEARLGHFEGEAESIAALEDLNQRMQDAVFDFMQQLQFQDIARQKLERVMNHLRGLQGVISGKMRDTK